MGTCNINHTHIDVMNKLQNQECFLPADLASTLRTFLELNQDQETLNEVFHLLKKYDLASTAEQADRNTKLGNFVK